MKLILAQTTSLIEIEKSKFISICGPLSNKDNFKDILANIKKEYPGARHYCYAYVVDNQGKSSDDGEPSGTAGRPLLSLLQSRDINNSYVVTVRYFGGIKLGASRLLRTYVDSAVKTLDLCKYGKEKEMIVSHIEELNYDEYYQLQNYANSHEMVLENVEFGNNINIDVISNNDIKDVINSLFKGKISIKETKKIIRIVED